MDGERLLDAYIRLVGKVGGVRTNIARLKRRREHARGLQEARRAIPYLGQVAKRFWAARRQLRAVHEHYTTFVSSPGHAISLESSALLYALLEVVSPKDVLELGSGFTSYVVRLYQARVDPSVRVKSIDDSPHWLERTREYLFAKGLGTEGLVGPEELGATDVGRYDVVSYDFGSMETRAAWLDRVLSYVRPATGVLLVDDCHFDDYRERLVEATRALGARRHDMRAFTFDPLGRFADLVTEIPEPTAAST